MYLLAGGAALALHRRALPVLSSRTPPILPRAPGPALLLPDDRVHVQSGLVTDDHVPVGHSLAPGSSTDHGPDGDAPDAAVIIIIINIIIISIIIIIITDLSLSLLCR